MNMEEYYLLMIKQYILNNKCINSSDNKDPYPLFSCGRHEDLFLKVSENSF